MDDSRRIPRTVWVLGGVSLFMDMSSELIHAVLPVYMTAVLGLSVLTVGIIEGIAEATASISKVFSGYVSDRFARRKPLVLLGYGLSALTKPLFPLADGAVGVVAARFADRVGKGIRGAPRDALVADVTQPELRDAAYGLRQALDTVGAFVGPLLAMLFLWMWANDLRAVLWVAVVPAFAAVALIVAGVEEPDVARARAGSAPMRLASVAAMPPAFWRLIALAALFALARISEAFLVLRAQEIGLPVVWIPMVMIVMSAVYSVASYPAGLLGARFGRGALLAGSLVALVAAQGALAALSGSLGLGVGAGLWGLHRGLSQGGLSAAVAAAARAASRATAFGVFHFVTGVFQLASGAVAGWLWLRYGSALAFGSGAAWALLALAVLATALPRAGAPAARVSH